MIKYRKWMLPALSLVLAVAALIAYTLMQEERTTLMYVQVMAAALVPAIVPLISTITKKEFPPIVNILITVHVLLLKWNGKIRARRQSHDGIYLQWIMLDMESIILR